MANWYYYNEDNNKIGPISWKELTRFVQLRMITPDTMLEDSEGHPVAARYVNGLTFFEGVLSESPLSEPTNQLCLSVDDDDNDNSLVNPVSVHYRHFIHPEDEIARQRLEAVPGFRSATKWFMGIGVETLCHGLFMADKIRLSPTQLPELYNHLPPICQKLGIAEPEFYLEAGPPNAYTLGDTRTFLVVTSGLLNYVKNDAELVAVLAHECGHILCRHVLYHTMAALMVETVGAFGVLGNLASGPIRLALNYWRRRSELSADRAGLVYFGDSAPVVGYLARFAGGPAMVTGNINFEEFADQAKCHQDLQQNSKWQKLLQTSAVMNQTHPYLAVRAHEILKWERSEQCQQLLAVLNKEDRHPNFQGKSMTVTQRKVGSYHEETG